MLAALKVFLAATVLFAEELRFYEPEMVYREEGSSYFRCDGKHVAEEDAKSVAEYIYHTYGEDERPSMYLIPGQQDYYLVSGYASRGKSL